ncbi:MAG: hypothetical protein V1728_01555 [Candidatus Micrarchaeota archaeon]
MGFELNFIRKNGSPFSSWHLYDYELSAMQENLEMAVYCVVCFFLPFFLSEQLVLGTLVNAGLVLGALNLRGWKVLPVILLPSFGVLAAGLLFGSFTYHLVALIPAIWVGNALLVWAVKEFALTKKMNRLLALGVGIGSKVAWLFGITFALVSLGFVPAMFLTAMGPVQLYTAAAGSVLALGAQEMKKRI